MAQCILVGIERIQLWFREWGRLRLCGGNEGDIGDVGVDEDHDRISDSLDGIGRRRREEEPKSKNRRRRSGRRSECCGIDDARYGPAAHTSNQT